MNPASKVSIVSAVVGLVCLAAATPARAALFFDFEDGTLQGWLPASTGGSGTTTLAAHNGSQMAFVQQTHPANVGSTTARLLSHDFTYVATDLLSFDMQAVAVTGSAANAVAGVTVSFLNAFNVSLGSFSLFNTTAPGSLGPNQYPIDNQQHHYGEGATMATFAAQAGINPALPISKISLSFVAYSNSFGSGLATGSVWFDNVQVGAIPEPGTQGLLLAGLGLTAIAAQRRLLPSAPKVCLS